MNHNRIATALLILIVAAFASGCNPSGPPKEVQSLKQSLITYKITFQNDRNSLKDVLKAQNDLEVQLLLAEKHLSQIQSEAVKEVLSLSKEHYNLLRIHLRNEQEQARARETDFLIKERADKSLRLLDQAR